MRNLLRYCDRYSDGKAISIYRGHQPYDDTELRTVKGWRKIYRKPISEDYIFSMRANRQGGEWYDYCFAEDTIELSEDEKELKRQYIAKFGGWEKIDLEHTEYNGKKWY